MSSNREEHLPYMDRNSFTFGDLRTTADEKSIYLLEKEIF